MNLKLMGLMFVILVIGIVWRMGYTATQMTRTSGLTDHQLTQLVVGSRELTVEVVTTPASTAQGLSGRSAIGSDGMLFVFSSPRRPQFWMKEMQFDLDLVWISDNRVVEITANVPHPDSQTPLSELPHYSPAEPVDQVLEIPAGQAAAWSLQPGDSVRFASGNR